jgi:hypothetical protein
MKRSEPDTPKEVGNADDGERAAKRQRLIAPLSPECQQLVGQILGRNAHIKELVELVRRDAVGIHHGSCILLPRVSDVVYEKAVSGQWLLSFYIAAAVQFSVPREPDLMVECEIGTDGCDKGDELYRDLEPRLHRLLDDTKPEKLLPYLEKLKKYADTLAESWARVHLGMTERLEMYADICALLGVATLDAGKQHEFLVSPSTKQLEFKFKDRRPEPGVFHKFIRYLTDLHKVSRK